MNKPKQISIVGPNDSGCTPEMYTFGQKLGTKLARAGYHIVCGGMGGIMEAVCQGVRSVSSPQRGICVGIIPGSDRSEANPHCDVVVPSGIGLARNTQVVLSGDIIIAIAGGAGTLSELAYAWQFGKTVLCVCGFGGWSEKVAGTQLDPRKKDLLRPVNSVEEIMAYLNGGF
jgi:uncharacterized protein (TIGR00725 family)